MTYLVIYFAIGVLLTLPGLKDAIKQAYEEAEGGPLAPIAYLLTQLVIFVAFWPLYILRVFK